MSEGDKVRVRHVRKGSSNNSRGMQTSSGNGQLHPSGIDAAHACNILDQLKIMYDEGKLTDIVVQVDQGVNFSCHRNVLAAISPYFRSMFTSGLTESTQKEVRLLGVDPESMQLILNYAYTSSVVLTEANVQSLFSAASLFQISCLQDQCARFMTSRLDPQNCIGVFIFADHYDHRQLKEHALTYIYKKFLDVTQEQEFLHLSKEQLICILKSDNLDIDKEEYVYDSIIYWFQHDPAGREAYLSEIFAKCVRMALLEEAFVKRIPPMFARALPRVGYFGASDCIQRLGMTSSEMILCFESATKHSGKKQAVVCLDISNGKIYLLTKPPGDVREVGITVTPDNEIFIAGGYKPSNNDVSIDHKAEGDFFCYDHSLIRWSQKAALLRARIGCKLVFCSGKHYAIGGRVYEGDGRNALKSVECYDPRDNRWTTVCAMPVAMEHHCAVVYKEKIYVLQGDLFLCYDPDTDYWCYLSPMTVPRTQGLAAAYKGYIYCIAGIHQNNRVHTVEAYDVEQNHWIVKNDLPCESSTNPYLRLLILKNKLHLLVRATHVCVEEFLFRTCRKITVYEYDDEADVWRKVYETPDKMWDLGRHFECTVARLYPQSLQKVL
ncbi:kelch repeat and BTB domain-containing protein 8 [Pelodytes ibericus]